MTVYVIVQLKITDRAAYDRYQAHFFDVFKGLEDAHHATRGWVPAGEARRVLDHAIAAYGSTSQG